MKKIYFLILGIGISNIGVAQTNVRGYTHIYAGVGTSLTSPSKVINVNIETSSPKALKFGVNLEQTFYSSKKGWKNDFFDTEQKMITAGIYGKLSLSSSRNFAMNFSIGGNAGSDSKEFIYYPKIGLEECFWLSPNLQFVLSQNAAYLFNSQFTYKWLPTLNIGLKFGL